VSAAAGGRRGRVVFLDRDGTLNAEVGFVTSPAKLRVLPDSRAALHRLATAGFQLVVVTNQSGIARGLYDSSDLARVHEALHAALDGLPLAYLHCPHHPEMAGPYGGDCACRKPSAGLLNQARDLLGIDLHDAWLLGDAARDLLMARGLPIRTIHLHSGKAVATEQATLQAAGFRADHDAPDLATAVDWLLAQDPDGRRPPPTRR
jgi:D-glycero-D-manno-heptose 1,7-bisphosphate phosphatase